jgi:protein SCO1/2/putative membrane protein
MNFFSVLPHLNACLNATSGVLLLAGFYFIRTGRVASHLRCMTAAIFVSVAFLISYLVYHAQHGSTRFAGQGYVRPVYFTILLTHTVLAAVIVPLVAVTFRRARRGDFARHRRIARWTFPLWLYVSVTGVVVYLMLYQLYPAR